MSVMTSQDSGHVIITSVTRKGYCTGISGIIMKIPKVFSSMVILPYGNIIQLLTYCHRDPHPASGVWDK